MTQKERLATLEAQQEAHGREHLYLRELWSAELEAINARLGSIETALRTWRTELNGTTSTGLNGAHARRRVSMRDVSISGGSLAVATVLWWLVEVLRGAVEG